jgi:hypothetical protein
MSGHVAPYAPILMSATSNGPYRRPLSANPSNSPVSPL